MFNLVLNWELGTMRIIILGFLFICPFFMKILFAEPQLTSCVPKYINYEIVDHLQEITNANELFFHAGVQDISIRPDEVNIFYSPTDSSCLNPLEVNVNNFDSINFTNNEFATSISYSLHELSYIFTIKNILNEGTIDESMVMKSVFYHFNDSFQISLTLPLEPDSDPFQNALINTSNVVENELHFGYDDFYCQISSIAYDVNGVQYSSSYNKSDDTQEWVDVITYKGYDGGQCKVKLITSENQIYYGIINLIDEKVNVSIVNNQEEWIVENTGKSYLEIPLYLETNNSTDPNNPDKFIRFNLKNFSVHDTSE